MALSKPKGLANRTGAVALVLLMLSVISGDAWAEASAIAFGNGGKWGWATRSSQSEANRVALTSCNEITPERDCKLDKTKAIARAEGPGSIGFGKSADGLDGTRDYAYDQYRDLQDSNINQKGFWTSNRVPVPASVTLIGLGLVCLLASRRKHLDV